MVVVAAIILNGVTTKKVDVANVVAKNIQLNDCEGVRAMDFQEIFVLCMLSFIVGAAFAVGLIMLGALVERVKRS